MLTTEAVEGGGFGIVPGPPPEALNTVCACGVETSPAPRW
ncbi:hypothetical protein HMPREF0742_00585 [Rothia aeria F0184]|uniref:Uncharacterized protein n=1 Tax=Rothia aeria F0184 TaxID=888019 RepID=U7V8T9_9MICC|nr:hypothetical protein HMPREF0742_00585 [Rothia aeria F0184]